MRRISWLPTALFVTAVPLFLVTAAVAWAFNSPGVYQRGFEKYDVSRITGITEDDLEKVSADIRGYFNSRQEPMLVRARIFGQEEDLFNQREITHLRDVKRLVWGVYVIAAATALYLITATGLRVVRLRQGATQVLAHRFMLGGGLTVVLILAVGLFALAGFDTLFLKFHQLSFANDLWQLDRRTDRLVMLFPQDFWFDATMWVATRAIAAGLALTALGGGYLLYLRQRAPKKSEGRERNLERASEA